MRKTITLLLCAILLAACSSVKRNQKFLATGNYDQAIQLAVKKIQKDRDNAKSEAHMIMLEEAFARVVEEDARRIDFLKKENRPGSEKELYHIYLDLDQRQNLLRPLLPLYSESLGRNVNIYLIDYSDDLLHARADYAKALYEDGQEYMQRNSTLGYRKAFDIFSELNNLMPNYKDVNTLKEDAHFYGTDFVYVTLNNRSNQVIPQRLERDLLNFNTYGLDDFWTEYHNARQTEIDYNYGIALNFRSIQVSPEQIFEKEIIRKKRIKDGWVFKRDRNGDFIRDSLGNRIKVDKYIVVRARVTVTEQSKAVSVGGNVAYRDLVERRDLNNHPLATEFVFQNVFAHYRGDERALTNEDLALVDNNFVPFPTNAQMVLDAGDDLKSRLKQILKRNSLR